MADDQLRRTEVQVLVEGVDITDELRKDHLSITYTDNEDGETDDLQITIADPEDTWLSQWLASTVDNVGMTMEVVLTAINWDGSGGSQSLRSGLFELDAPGATGPPSTVTLRGTSLEYGSGLRKKKKDKDWCDYTLQRIASELAAAGGLTLVYESSVDPEYERVEQSKQTDMDFLQDLCEKAGNSIKVTDSQLVIFDQATYEAKPAIRTITRGDGTYISWDLGTAEADTAYTSVRVRYTNPLTKETYDATYVVDEDEDADDETANRLNVGYIKVSSNGEALAMAEKLARLHNKFTRTVSFTVPGDPTAVAAVNWQLEGWGFWDGKYIITQSTQQVGDSGWETDVTLRPCQV